MAIRSQYLTDASYSPYLSTMEKNSPILVTLAISSQCPHCEAMLQILTKMVKNGDIARLEIVNLMQDPDFGERQKIRSVPWLSIGSQSLTGLRSETEIQTILAAKSFDARNQTMLELQLADGDWQQVSLAIQKQAERIYALVPFLEDVDVPLQVRLGANVVLEDLENSDAIRLLVPDLSKLCQHEDYRVRIDACYALGLTHSAAAIKALQSKLQDANEEVREIAAESLDKIAKSQ